jgi:hypothetical protein
LDLLRVAGWAGHNNFLDFSFGDLLLSLNFIVFPFCYEHFQLPALSAAQILKRLHERSELRLKTLPPSPTGKQIPEWKTLSGMASVKLGG